MNLIKLLHLGFFWVGVYTLDEFFAYDFLNYLLTIPTILSYGLYGFLPKEMSCYSFALNFTIVFFTIVSYLFLIIFVWTLRIPNPSHINLSCNPNDVLLYTHENPLNPCVQIP